MAKRLAYIPGHAAIYPGIYEPLPWKEEELLNHIQRKGPLHMNPPINISELEHYYKLEMNAPGFKTEDFYIYTNGTMVHIAAYHRLEQQSEAARYHTHDFHIDCIEQQINLPENTDTNFATAEYRDGVLRMHFSKSGAHSRNQPGRLIVY